MSLLASVAVGSEKDVLGIALQASESCIAIELEDSSLHIFDAQGKLVRVFETDENKDSPVTVRRLRKTFTVAGRTLVIAKELSSTGEDGMANKASFLEILDFMTSTIVTSIDISEQPKTIASYRDGDLDHIIVSPHAAHVQLITLSESSPTLLTSPTAKTITATADIPSFRIWKHQIAHSILALLGVRDGIVQLWRLPSSTHSETRFITNLGTIYSIKESPDATSASLGKSEETSSNNKSSSVDKIYSILVHSSGRVLTGHEDGKIKVWECSTMLSDDMSLSGTEDHRGGKNITKPNHVVQNSTPGKLINGLLEYSHQTSLNSNSSNIVATDVDGFVRIWRFQEDKVSRNELQLTLVGQHKLFDHSVLGRAITKKGWLVAGGKEGIDEDGSTCGLNAQLKMLNLASLAVDSQYSSPEIRELGGPSMAVWDLKIVDSLLEEGSEHAVVSLMRRGGAWLEVWKV